MAHSTGKSPENPELLHLYLNIDTQANIRNKQCCHRKQFINKSEDWLCAKHREVLLSQTEHIAQDSWIQSQPEE